MSSRPPMGGTPHCPVCPMPCVAVSYDALRNTTTYHHAVMDCQLTDRELVRWPERDEPTSGWAGRIASRHHPV